MFPMFALVFLFSPMFAIVDPVMASVGVGVVLIAGVLVYANKDKLGLSGDKTFGALADTASKSPFVKKFNKLTATGKNLVGYTDMKIASLIVPGIVDAEDRVETEAAFATILIKLSKAKLVAASPIENPTATATKLP